MTDSNTMPDFFELLELDPEAPWNDNLFTTALSKKRNEWATRSRNGTPHQRDTAKRNLGLVSSIKEELSDPAKRAKHIQRARDARNAAHQDAWNNFSTSLELLKVKGYLLESEVTNLIAKFGPKLGQAECRAQIANIDVRPDQTAARSQTLPDTTRDEIARLLEIVKKTDLYDFLAETPVGGRRWASEKLRDEAKKKESESTKNPNKTPDVVASGSLAGHAMDIFRDDKNREIYNATLADDVYRALDRDTDTLLALTSKVSSEQVAHLLETAKGVNGAIDLGLARDRIVRRVQEKGKLIEVPLLESIEKKQPCGECGSLNPPESKYCQSCSKALVENCPKCNKTVPSAHRACSHCGFPVGNRGWVEELLQQSSEPDQSSDLPRTIATLHEARAGWPAPSSDQLAKRLDERIAGFEKVQQEHQKLLGEIDNLVKQCDFYAARMMLNRLPQTTTKQKSIALVVNGKIAETEKALAAAAQLSGEAAVEAFQHILATCRDCKPAQERLRQMPPEAPSNLQIGGRKAVIQLQWTASPSRGVRYVITRKTHARPTSIDDGERVGTVPGLNIDDTNAPVGLPLWYAVFAERSGVPSHNAALVSHPVLRTAEVQDLVARAEDGQIRLSWQPPANVHRVVVVRSRSTTPPSGPTDGLRIDAPNQRETLDSGLQNGQLYHYAVFCEFVDQNGKPVVTDGVQVAATPQVPPQPVEMLDIQSTENNGKQRIRIHWNPPPKGQVQIIQSIRSLALEGQVAPSHVLPSLGVPIAASTPPLVLDVNPNTTTSYFTPAVVFEDTAYFGPSHRWVNIPDVSDLRAVNYGSLIQVMWTWPQGITEVQLAWSTEGWPATSVDSNRSATQPTPSVQKRITQAEYIQDGCASIRQPAPADWYIVAQSLTLHDNQPVLSTGVRTQVHVLSRVRLEYEIQKPLFGGKRQLVLRPSGPVTLPTLILRGKPGNPPSTPNDGECVKRIAGPLKLEGETKFVIDAPKARNLFVKLFPETSDPGNTIEIFHPKTDRLQLK